MKRDITLRSDALERFTASLREEEKAEATIGKYRRDADAFIRFAGRRKLTKNLCSEYKAQLCERYKPSSVNSILSAVNSFLSFMGHPQLKLKKLKIQRKLFHSVAEELTREEYERLVRAAKDSGNERLALILETICSTGIRVSELKHVTVNALYSKNAEIMSKGKVRDILMPDGLVRKLKAYCKARRIRSGQVFVTSRGNAVDRSNIWKEMKILCQRAKVDKRKVFPHNLRHLFARTYYALEKDLNRLADILGHSSIETTRIYTMISAQNERKKIERLGFVLTEHNIM